MLFQVINTIFDNEGDTSISIQSKRAGKILFQDCQFFVNTAIYITLEKSNPTFYPRMSVPMANCLISKTTEHLGNISHPVIDTNTKILLRVWNVTIYTNNTNYTSDHKDFDRYLGDNIVVNESCFISGIILKFKWL